MVDKQNNRIYQDQFCLFIGWLELANYKLGYICCTINSKMYILAISTGADPGFLISGGADLEK